MNDVKRGQFSLKRSLVRAIKKTVKKEPIPYAELELQLFMPFFMENAHLRGCKCIKYPRRKISSAYHDNVSRLFGNILNYYTTNKKRVVIPAAFGFFLTVFDQYSDIKYVFGTEFNEQWMYYISFFVVLFPFLCFLVISCRKYRSPTLFTATFIGNIIHHEHALGKEEDLEE
jgi:hypothetical protein